MLIQAKLNVELTDGLAHWGDQATHCIVWIHTEGFTARLPLVFLPPKLSCLLTPFLIQPLMGSVTPSTRDALLVRSKPLHYGAPFPLVCGSYQLRQVEPRPCWVWWWGWRCAWCRRHWPCFCHETLGPGAHPVSAARPWCPPGGVCTALKGKH